MPLFVSGLTVNIRVNALRENRDAWGDSQYAEGLARAIGQRPGCSASLIFRGERPAPSDLPRVLLQIAGPHLEEPIPGIVNLLWLISPPNMATRGMLARYQSVFTAARYLTNRLQDLGIAAEYLPQATDTDHFHPARSPKADDMLPVVFVGGYAPRVDRRIVLEAVQAGFEPQIWGPGWKGVVPNRLWRGERLDYDALAAVYARARIVLNSHMDGMAALGFMSNRSYDAIASGAEVVSDPVFQFSDPDFPEIRQVRDRAEMTATLDRILAAPAASLDERIARHTRIATHHCFQARADVILSRARALLDRGEVAPPAFWPGRSGAASGWPRLPAGADALATALLAAAQEIVTTAHSLEQPQPQPQPPPSSLPQSGQGLIHALSADLHEIRQIARHGVAPPHHARIEQLAARGRRLMECMHDPVSPLRLRASPAEREPLLARVINNEPLWPHGPEGFARDNGKAGLSLRPRAQRPGPARSIGVFLHLYYDELAPVFAERLARIVVPKRVYVSTDTLEKAARIREHLPDAEIGVFANRGRDIWPKLYGFAGAHARHDIVLHLHGKRSLHSSRLDDWLVHILDCLLGSEGEVNRILSFFETIPALGMVVPVTFRAVLGAAHWGANRDIARELARRMALPGPLPDDKALRFPVGSMFWARSAAIRPLLELNLPQDAFPPEAGQVDGTLAHAVERMLGVTCRAGGAHILPVMGAGAKLYRKHQMAFTSNRDLRDALASGAFHD